MKPEIYKWSVFYELLRIYVNLAQRLFYHKIIVQGKENIPLNVPVILAPNHQNAIMDALAIVYSMPGQTVFMARADVFKNQITAKILKFLKIMPIYRMRDGIENIEKNKELFEEAIELLQHNKTLCLMPEGTHGNKRHLRPLLKGIFRIAFWANERCSEKQPVIIPVGIDYSDYSSFRSQLVIKFGKPIQVSGFYPEFKTNPAKAINRLKEALSMEMKRIMINIDCGEYYQMVDYLRNICRQYFMNKEGFIKKNAWQRFLSDKNFTEKFNQLYISNPLLIDNLNNEIINLRSDFKSIGIPDKMVFNKPPTWFQIILKSILLILVTPIFLFGYIIHIGIVRLPKIINRNIEDTQFHSSIKFMVTTFLFPIFYILLWFIFLQLIHNIWISLFLIILDSSNRYFLGVS